MPKQKTHKGMSKVFKERKNDYKTGTPNGRHNTGKKNQYYVYHLVFLFYSHFFFL